MSTRPLQFLRRGQTVTLHDVPPDRTLLEVLREDLSCTDTKEGCGEGDCGACTVVIAQAHQDGEHSSLRFRSINSCIRLAHSIDGMALWTAEDLLHDPLIEARQCGGSCGEKTASKEQTATPAPHAAHAANHGQLHPVQQAMLECHGSQCGFCTPGFVMSLFGVYENHVLAGERLSRSQMQEALSGNLCRCTGYRPILDAAQQMATLPMRGVNQVQVLSNLKLLAQIPPAPEADFTQNPYLAPVHLADLLKARAALPHAQIVAGCTDVGLWVTKQHRQFKQVLDVTRAIELQRISPLSEHGGWAIGAAVPLEDAFTALCEGWPQLHAFHTRFAGLPVRNSGTLGGNVANGSPIGDSMPLLIAMGAQVVLASVRGERAMPVEDLYTGYRTNVMAADELLVRVEVPAPHHLADLRAYKISKRFDDDISAVCLVIDIHVENGVVRHASLGAGGVAATPVRARAAEAALISQPWNQTTIQAAQAALQAEFSPISDMRASGNYRRTVLASLLQRYWLESQGVANTSLETIAQLQWEAV